MFPGIRLPRFIYAENTTASIAGAVCPEAVGRKSVAWSGFPFLAVAAGLPLLVWPGLAQPFSQPKVFFLVAAVAVSVLAFPGRIYAAWLELGSPLQQLTAAWLVALSLAAIFGRSVALDAFLLPVAGLGWFLATQRTVPDARLFARALELSATCIAAIALAQMLHVDPFVWMGWSSSTDPGDRMRVFSTLGNPNFVAAYLCGSLPLSLASLRQPRKSWAHGVALPIQLGGIVATGSRAPLLALVAVAIWWMALRQWGLLRRLAIAAAFALLAASLLQSGRSLAAKLEGRAYIWSVAVPHLLEHPLLGVGPGGFATMYPAWEAVNWSQGHYLEQQKAFSAPMDHAHNDFLELLVEGGAVSLAAWMALMAALLGRVARQLRARANGITAGASAGVVAILGVALVDFPLHRPAELFLLWSLLALCCIPPAQYAVNRNL